MSKKGLPTKQQKIIHHVVFAKYHIYFNTNVKTNNLRENMNTKVKTNNLRENKDTKVKTNIEYGLTLCWSAISSIYNKVQGSSLSL